MLILIAEPELLAFWMSKILSDRLLKVDGSKSYLTLMKAINATPLNYQFHSGSAVPAFNSIYLKFIIPYVPYFRHRSRFAIAPVNEGCTLTAASEAPFIFYNLFKHIITVLLHDFQEPSTIIHYLLR